MYVSVYTCYVIIKKKMVWSSTSSVVSGDKLVLVNTKGVQSKNSHYLPNFHKSRKN